ncbi:hypothetical protein PIB30_042809 [Stylosanthes scabra]|uniref:Uncharacterized protein n=1 Tax=Stylosanthes scabra TaxID=79078 RepID=A0ABU6SGE2_9FABA|nr:hypothetical protein [Stylosanthes scabra]
MQKIAKELTKIGKDESGPSWTNLRAVTHTLFVYNLPLAGHLLVTPLSVSPSLLSLAVSSPLLFGRSLLPFSATG